MCENVEEFHQKYDLELGDEVTYVGCEVELNDGVSYENGDELEVFEIRPYNNSLVIGEDIKYPIIVNFSEVKELAD